MQVNIFLDDFRIPRDSYNYTKNPIYLNKEWAIVRDYKEFVDLLNEIHTLGNTIGSISFDHDLADEHYTPEHMYGVSAEVVYDKIASTYKEKTGLDCAKYLTAFLDEHDLPIPGMTCHSMNPVGKKKIEEHLMDWMDGHGGDDADDLDEQERIVNAN